MHVPKTNFLDESFYNFTDFVEDAYNVLNRYGISVEDLINLSGGVPSRGIEFLILDAKSVSETTFHVVIETNLYDTARRIDFEDKEIENNGMFVYNPDNWIGTTLFLNQVKEARRQGFSFIKTIAEGPDVASDRNGHYRWGRVGYQMNSQDKLDFDIWVRSLKMFDDNLGELLLTDEGCRRWLLGGFTWSGKFFLDSDGDCMLYLIDYLERKGIPFIL